MKSKEFYKIYIPALEKALINDNINYGYNVYSPDFYIEEQYLDDIDDFINKSEEYAYFFDMIGYYFDAKSHNSDKIQEVDIEIYKNKIIIKLNKIKDEYKI